MYSVKMVHQTQGFRVLASNEYRCVYSKLWSKISPGGYFCVDDGLAKRHYSAITKCNLQTLNMKKLQNASLQVSSRRNIQEYNVFYNLIDLLEKQYLFVHDNIGLPWWATIVFCTLPLRMTVSYVSLKYGIIMKYKQVNVGNNLLPPVMKAERQKLRKSPHYKALTNKEAASHLRKLEKSHMKRLSQQEGYHPAMIIFYNLLPLPFWVANSLAIQRLSGANFYFNEQTEPHIGMLTEGLFWFKDLSVPDPYCVLPVTIFVGYIMTMQLVKLSNPMYGKLVESGGYQKFVRRLQRFYETVAMTWTTFFVYICLYRPSGMVFYWSISSLTALCMRFALMHPSFEQRFMPKHMHDTERNLTPYTTIYNNIKKKIGLNEKNK